MPNLRITKRAVDAATASDKPVFIWDTDIKGFGLKVTPGGRKVYLLQYRTGGRESTTKRFTIGEHGSPWTADAARDEARALLTKIHRGEDPRDTARKRKNAAKSLAFEDYVVFYTDSYLKKRWERTWREAERILNHNVNPVFRKKPLPEITKGDIVSLLESMNDRPALKRLTYAVLNKLFNWAHKTRDDLASSPMDKIDAPSPVRKRQRVLSAEELAAFYLAAKDTPYPFGPYFILLAATLQRKHVRRRNIWHSLRRRSAEYRPRLGLMLRRRACGGASADVRVSFA